MSVRKCYKQDEYVSRIQRALGVSLGNVACHIVDQEGMKQVMSGAGWSASDALGVVGFQVGPKVYVLDRAPWTVLHELIHLAGVNADRVSQFVAEGLTEAIAEELRTGPDEHRPTYPKETAWVKGVLLPKLGMTAVQLGRVVARSPDPPFELARLMAKAKPGASVDALRQQLRPQGTCQPSLNRQGRGHVTMGSFAHPSASDGTTSLAGVLIISGISLLIPRLLR